MKTKLFLVGLLSFFYVNSQVVRLVELPVPDLGITSTISTIFGESGAASMDAPPNDECDGAIELTVNADYACGTVTAATLLDATDSGVEAEVGDPDDDVWFSFTATGDTHKISLLNIEADHWSGEDLVIEVMSGSCGDLTLKKYSDPESVIVSGLSPETVYYVRVFSYYDYVVDTTFDICIGTPPPAPANDDCAGAVVLTPSTTATCATPVAGTVQSATDSGLQSETGTADDDVWYSFVASSTSHLVRITNIEGDEATDLAYEILSGACDENEIIKSSDANSGIITDLTVGTTYYVRVFSYGSDNNADTTFDICVATPGAPPVNDECSNAISVTPNAGLGCDVVTSGTILYATDSGIEGEEGNPDDDVWYSFTATNSVHKISATNVNGDGYLMMEVFEESCDGQSVAYGDYDGFYATELTPETVYYVRVYSYGEDVSDVTFDLCIGTMPAPPANDECDGAIALTVNPDYGCATVMAATLQGATDSGFDSDEGTADDDVWFTFTATSTSHKISLGNIEASEWEGEQLTIEIMEGECGGLTVVEAESNDYVIAPDLTPETVYYVRVFSSYESIVDTTFDICVGTTPEPPVNDDCSGAISLTVNPTMACAAVTAGTLQSATDSGVESENGEADDDVWFSFVATSETQMVSLKNVNGDETYVTFEVLEGECDAQNIIFGTTENLGLVSDLTVGDTYYVRVFTYYSDNNPDTTFNVCVATPDDAPANDDCDAAVVLTVNPDFSCASSVAGTLAFATDSNIAAETGTADDDVWYSFTATSSTHKVSVTNISGNFTDLALEVFEGDCGASIFQSTDNDAILLEDLIEDTVYYVRVYSYASDALALTTFNICVGTMPLSQPNDDCEDATLLAVNADGECTIKAVGSLAAATDSGIDAEYGNANDDVWYSFVALGPSQKITVNNIDDSEELVIELFSGACETLTYITNEEGAYIDGLTTGATYYVRVFSYTSSTVTSTFDICVSLKQAPPANDDCAGAIALTVDAAYCNGVLNNGTNLGSTDSGVNLPGCFNYGKNDVWFSFVAPENTATVDISTDFTGGSLVDTEIALYAGSCTGLLIRDCDQDSGETILSNGDSYNSIITNSPVVAGQTYYVRVSGYSEESEGSFCLEVSTNGVLSTEEFAKNSLKAYPNPVKNTLTLSNTTAITDVAIFNLLGQQIVTKAVNANEGQIDMSHLSAGAYLVRVMAENGVQTIKIIKE